MTSSYDKRSFLSGIAVGRQLKGWSTGGNTGGGGHGSLTITENGTYDVTPYAQAVVNVPTYSGHILEAIFLHPAMFFFDEATHFDEAVTLGAIVLAPTILFLPKDEIDT